MRARTQAHHENHRRNATVLKQITSEPIHIHTLRVAGAIVSMVPPAAVVYAAQTVYRQSPFPSPFARYRNTPRPKPCLFIFSTALSFCQHIVAHDVAVGAEDRDWTPTGVARSGPNDPDSTECERVV
jgi:hypothetical protein